MGRSHKKQNKHNAMQCNMAGYGMANKRQHRIDLVLFVHVCCFVLSVSLISHNLANH